MRPQSSHTWRCGGGSIPALDRKYLHISATAIFIYMAVRRWIDPCPRLLHCFWFGTIQIWHPHSFSFYPFPLCPQSATDFSYNIHAKSLTPSAFGTSLRYAPTPFWCECHIWLVPFFTSQYRSPERHFLGCLTRPHTSPAGVMLALRPPLYSGTGGLKKRQSLLTSENPQFHKGYKCFLSTCASINYFFKSLMNKKTILLQIML